MNQLNVIHHADCEKPGGMDRLADASIDLVFTDLPYGSTECEWDCPIPLEELWPQWLRVLKPNGAILLFAAQPFTSVLVCSNLPLYRDNYVWVKNKATGHLNARHRPLNSHEDILVFYRQQPTYNPQLRRGHRPVSMARSRNQSEVYKTAKGSTTPAGRTTRQPLDVLYYEQELDPHELQFNVVNNDDPERINATQKPVPLCRHLVRTYTNPDDVVLDCCAGSGSIALACLEEGRHHVGFEKRADQCEQARARLARFVKPPLFDLSQPTLTLAA